MITFIKNYAVTDFNPFSLINDQTKLLQQLFTNKKISAKSFSNVKKMMLDYLVYKDRNLIITSSKTKCLSIVENINDCYKNILLLQYKSQLKNDDLSDEEKDKINTKIKSLNIEINMFKKRKTKYHF